MQAQKEKDEEPVEDDGKPKIKYNNDIRDIRNVRQLEKVNLDFDSPRLRQAMDDLGCTEQEMKKK